MDPYESVKNLLIHRQKLVSAILAGKDDDRHQAALHSVLLRLNWEWIRLPSLIYALGWARDEGFLSDFVVDLCNQFDGEVVKWL